MPFHEYSNIYMHEFLLPILSQPITSINKGDMRGIISLMIHFSYSRMSRNSIKGRNKNVFPSRNIWPNIKSARKSYILDNKNDFDLVNGILFNKWFMPVTYAFLDKNYCDAASYLTSFYFLWLYNKKKEIMKIWWNKTFIRNLELYFSNHSIMRITFDSTLY